MFKLYDVVIAKSDFEKVPKGTLGTILIIHEDKKHFEVEFVDKDGQTLNIITVKKSDIMIWKQ